MLHPLLAALALGPLASPAVVQDLPIEPDPPWVDLQPLLPDEAVLAELGGRAAHLRLEEVQWNFTGDVEVKYRRKVLDLRTPEDLECASPLMIVVDPRDRQVVLHAALIHRDGVVLDCTKFSGLGHLEWQPDMDPRLDDGSRPAVLRIPDARVGDRIEYRYSILGRDREDGNLRFGTLDLGYKAPAGEHRYRILWPADEPLEVRSWGGAPGPQVQRTEKVVEYTWRCSASPALPHEKRRPDDYECCPKVEFSNAEDWDAVAAWGVGCFALPESQSQAVASLVQNLCREAAAAGVPGDAEARALAALRYVQSAIETSGVPYGKGTRMPRAPREVLAQGWGSNTDKAQLLVALLRSMDLNAAPALVSERFRGGLTKRLPSLKHFDHVLVRLTIDESVFWLDPCRTHEHAPLAERVGDGFGVALLLDGRSDALVPTTPSRREDRLIEQTFTYRNGGADGTLLEQLYVFHGEPALWGREQMELWDQETLDQWGSHEVRDRHPGAVASSPLAVDDSPDLERVALRRTYIVPSLWRPCTKHGIKDAHLGLPFIWEQVDRSLAQRSTPYATKSRNVVMRLVHVGGHTCETPRQREVSCALFDFKSNLTTTDEGVVLRAEYQTRADRVQPEDVPGVVRALEQANMWMHYDDHPDDACPEESGMEGVAMRLRRPLEDLGFQWTLAAVAGLLALLMVSMVRRRRRAPRLRGRRVTA